MPRAHPFYPLKCLVRSLLACAALSLAACGGGGGGGGGGSAPAPAMTYSVGGSLMGLAKSNTITLTNNGTDKLTLNNAASSVSQTFTFATKLTNAAAYNLTLPATAPTVQPCTSTYGAGTINAANVTNLNVICGQSGGSSTFTGAGTLTTARDYHTATLLPDGRVLVSGGSNGTALNSAELYDPGTKTWTVTGSFVTGRTYHTATLLPNGKVLVSGGSNGTAALTNAGLYDPVAGTWTPTGSLGTPRYNHTATLLPNGRVLVSGGSNGTALNSAELYDPVAGAWTPTGSLGTPRYNHTATLLPNGTVLVSGGYGGTGAGYLASAELYDPANGTWTATTKPLVTQRAYHTATLLPDGKVLVSGGYGGTGAGYLASAELYDPANGTWTATTNPLVTQRAYHTATLLPNGRVLVSGGFNGVGAGYLASAELYDPTTVTWTATIGSLATARAYHAAILLPNGRVLVSGGYNGIGAGYLASAELYW